jgi:TolA-binding protein
MAVLFLLLAFLVVVLLAAAGLENTDPSTATLFDRSFSQLSEGQLLVLAAALGFLVALFLFLAFGASRTRRSRRKELRTRRRDAEGRVDELERENARLQKDLASAREELDGVERSRADAVAERDRAESAADQVRAGVAADRDQAAATAADRDRAAATAADRDRVAAVSASDRTGATAIDDHPSTGDRSGADDRGTSGPPKPIRAIRERLTDDGGDPGVARDEHARAADEHATAADEHARAAEEETRRR